MMAAAPAVMVQAPMAGATSLDTQSTHTTLLLVIALLIACAFGYMVYRQKSAEKAEEKAAEKETEAAAQEAAAAAAQKTTSVHQSMTPEQKKKSDQQLKTCKQRYARVGTCHLDDNGTVYLQCKNTRYGDQCSLTCKSSKNKPRKYTAGSETSGPSPATCECPSKNNFKDTNVSSGCVAGDEKGSACATGWRGELCDTSGKFINCLNGGRQAGGMCVCTDEWVGNNCQYSTSKCNSIDPNAAVNDNGTCDCSTGYFGPECKSCNLDEGYTLGTDLNGTKSCQKGTACKVQIVAGTVDSPMSIPEISSPPAKTTSLDLNKYNITNTQKIRLKRTAGSEPCKAVFTAKDGSSGGCAFSVDLPKDQEQATTTELNANTGLSHVELGSAGSRNKSPPVAASNYCDSIFKALGATCTGSGNICEWNWV